MTRPRCCDHTAPRLSMSERMPERLAFRTGAGGAAADAQAATGERLAVR